jgi:diketogulonate reductase-like aldo/keto reductase
LKENVGAADLKLTSDEVEEITKIAEEADIPGERYGPDLLGSVLVESPALLNR